MHHVIFLGMGFRIIFFATRPCWGTRDILCVGIKPKRQKRSDLAVWQTPYSNKQILTPVKSISCISHHYKWNWCQTQTLFIAHIYSLQFFVTDYGWVRSSTWLVFECPVLDSDTPAPSILSGVTCISLLGLPPYFTKLIVTYTSVRFHSLECNNCTRQQSAMSSSLSVSIHCPSSFSPSEIIRTCLIRWRLSVLSYLTNQGIDNNQGEVAIGTPRVLNPLSMVNNWGVPIKSYRGCLKTLWERRCLWEHTGFYWFCGLRHAAQHILKVLRHFTQICAYGAGRGSFLGPGFIEDNISVCIIFMLFVDKIV